MNAARSAAGPAQAPVFRLRDREVAPPLLLAPMLDLAGRAFRGLVRGYGGCGLFYSEMLNARRAAREPDESPILAGFGNEPDLMLQLAGSEPEELSRAAIRLEAFQPAGFDWNLGCSRKKITQRGWGADLLKRPADAARALAALRRATARALTVKVRLPEQPEARSWSGFLRMLESEGADGVIVHPRTAERIFTRPARWEWIARAKACLQIPVVGNGDAGTAEEACALFRETGCDGVMIGRAAAARPWIFRETAARLAGQPVPAAPPAEEALEKLLALLGPELALPKRARELKTFCQYFALALPVPHWFWGPLQGLRRGPEIAAAAREFFQRRDSARSRSQTPDAGRAAQPPNLPHGSQ